MRGKRGKLLLIAVLVLSVIPLLGCGFLNRIVNPPALTTQQAVVIIQIAGVPYIDDYFKETVGEEEAESYGKIGPATSMAGWKADYQGNGLWQIEGPVTTDKWGQCLTIWTLDESDSAIHLIGFNCD
jgi:hypothetical protein